MFGIKLSIFSFFTELYDVIFTDFRAILRWIFLMKFYSIFENRLPGIGLCRYPKYSIWPQNGLKLDYIHVLMEKTSTVRKMENSVCLLNPITGNGYICSRVYQVPFVTSQRLFCSRYRKIPYSEFVRDKIFYIFFFYLTL